MKNNNTIEYFNKVSIEVFTILSEIKYSIRLLEINNERSFIGFSIDTEYFCAQITILTPGNSKYIYNRACSMRLYYYDDENLKYILFEHTLRPIEECVNFLINEDIASSIITPKYHLN